MKINLNSIYGIYEYIFQSKQDYFNSHVATVYF